MGSIDVLALCCLILLLPSIVLQGCAVFSPYWINDKNITSDCFRGVVYNSGCLEGVSGLGDAIMGLQITSFVILVFSVIPCVVLMCCEWNNCDVGDCATCILSSCIMCLFPIAGLLGLSGCVKVAMDFGSYGKGWAFYVSLAASCIEMLKVFCCCALCKAGTNENDNNDGMLAKMIENHESLFSFTRKVMDFFDIC